MWVPSKMLELFQLGKDTVIKLNEELLVVRAERDILKTQLAVSQNEFSWLSQRVNALEVERAQLIEKVHGIRAAVPMIEHRPTTLPIQFTTALFDDMGDKAAREVGLPSFEE